MAIPPVTIEFLARGVPNVAASIRNVSTTLARAEQQASRDAERGARARERAATQEAKAKIAAYKLADREQAKAIDQATRAAERAANAGVRAAQRAEREKVREVERAEKQKQAIRERSATMAGQYAARMATKESRAAAREGAARDRYTNAMVGAAGQGVANGARRVGSVAIGLASTAASLGGGFSIADSVSQEVRLRGQAATISASSMPDATGKRMTTAEIMKAARATAIRQSMDPEEVLAGIGKFKDLTGDTARGVALMPHIAQLATAFGANASELAENAGNISSSSPGMSNDDVMKLLRVQTQQGAVGAVELKDMAVHGARLTAGASLFGGDRATNIATMGAFAQVARQHGGAASPAEATLAAQRFATDVAKHHKGIEAAGIKVSDGKGGLRAADEIVKDMLTKSGGDVLKFGQFGLGERGNKVLTGFADIYKQGGGGAKGMAAVNGELAKYTSGVSDADIEVRERERLGEVDKQLTGAMNALRMAAGEQLLPVFLEMLPALKQMIPLFIDAAKVGIPAFTDLTMTVAQFTAANKGVLADIAAHPIGAIMAFEVTKSITSAGLGEVIKRLLTSAAPGMAGGGGAGAGGGAAAGAGLAGGFVAAGAVAQVAGFWDVYSGTRNTMAEGQAGGTAAGNALVNGTAAERAKAEADIAAAKNASGDGATAAAWTDRLTKGVSYLAAPMMGVGALASYGAEQAMGSYAPGAQAEKAIKASEFVDAAELSRITTQAIANGVREGVAQGSSSGPNGTGRSEPIISR